MNDEIQTLVQTTLQAQIIRAFKDAPEAIDVLVKSAIEQEVNEYGGKPEYHSRQKMPYLTWLVGEEIRKVARAAVTEAIASREAEIKASVAVAITADKLVDGLTSAILGSIRDDYRVEIKFADQREA